jgi:hypothetical protein
MPPHVWPSRGHFLLWRLLHHPLAQAVRYSTRPLLLKPPAADQPWWAYTIILSTRQPLPAYVQSFVMLSTLNMSLYVTLLSPFHSFLLVWKWISCVSTLRSVWTLLWLLSNNLTFTVWPTPFLGWPWSPSKEKLTSSKNEESWIRQKLTYSKNVWVNTPKVAYPSCTRVRGFYSSGYNVENLSFVYLFLIKVPCKTQNGTERH